MTKPESSFLLALSLFSKYVQMNHTVSINRLCSCTQYTVTVIHTHSHIPSISFGLHISIVFCHTCEICRLSSYTLLYHEISLLWMLPHDFCNFYVSSFLRRNDIEYIVCVCVFVKAKIIRHSERYRFNAMIDVSTTNICSVFFIASIMNSFNEFHWNGKTNRVCAFTIVYMVFSYTMYI